MKNRDAGLSIFRSPYRRYLIGQSDSDKSNKKQLNSDQIEANSNMTNTDNVGNIFYDGPGSSIESTQQIKIDYSKFENHTFFDSATSKVNIAFDKIINEFPYDGDKNEFTNHMKNRTGFEKYVFDNINKSFGYLNFAGTDSHIAVKDLTGNLFPSISSNSEASSVLSPRNNPFNIEFFINPGVHEVTGSNITDPQTICQFSGSNSTISVFLKQHAGINESKVNLEFHILSASNGNNYHSYVSSSIDKNKFSHISLVYPANETNNELSTQDQQRLLIYVDGNLKARSTQQISFGDLKITGPQDFNIGSGSKMYTPNNDQTYYTNNYFEPACTFSGSIDEFRYYHRLRGQTEIFRNMKSNVFNENALKLYFKFNEIKLESSSNAKSVVIDSSGNSLHTKISNYGEDMRVVQTGSKNVFDHMYLEHDDLNPVLFLSDTVNADLQDTLLASASLYDDINPNLITRLVPSHYFEEGKIFQGLNNITGSLADKYTMSSIPGSGKLNTGQILTSFLLIFAKHFDELKIYIDTMSMIHNYGLQENDVPVDNFILETARRYGLELPGLFNGVDSVIFNQGGKLGEKRKISDLPLQQVQNKIWKRILTNYRSILKQKGTVDSIKQIIRSVGIEPDEYFTIREFGGNNRFYLEGLRENNIVKNVNFLDFSGSIGAPHHDDATRNSHGFAEGSSGIGGSPFMTSSFLVDSTGRFDNSVNKTYFPDVGSTATEDRFLTSGSFTYEGVYTFDTSKNHPLTQSLCRISVTGTGSPVPAVNGVLTNLVLVKTETSCSLNLYLDPSVHSTTSKLYELKLENEEKLNLFNGNSWFVSFGLIRNDDIFYYSEKNNNLSEQPLVHTSSIFIRCMEVGNSNNSLFATSSLFTAANETRANTNNFFRRYSPASNRDGPFLCFGSQSIALRDKYFLNSTAYDNKVRYSNLSGKINFIRFYSNSLTEEESREHARNPFSIGTDDPQTKYGHIATNKPMLGNFNRIRMRANIAEQYTSASNANGEIKIFDFSQNNYHFSAQGFEANKRILKKDSLIFSRVSTKFSELQSNNKVRIRGFDNSEELKDKPWASLGNVFDISESKRYRDDARISIESSIVKKIDENIINMISSLEVFDQILGDPSNVFESEYIELENLRKQFFVELTEKVDLNAYSDFFAWFDDTLTDLISDFIPVRSKFLGVNNVIESHILERNKNRYHYDKMYAVNEYDSAGYFTNGSDLGLNNLGGDE